MIFLLKLLGLFEMPFKNFSKFSQNLHERKIWDFIFEIIFPNLFERK